jgi:hypothetical protein
MLHPFLVLSYVGLLHVLFVVTVLSPTDAFSSVP